MTSCFVCTDWMQRAEKAEAAEVRAERDQLDQANSTLSGQNTELGDENRDLRAEIEKLRAELKRVDDVIETVKRRQPTDREPCTCGHMFRQHDTMSVKWHCRECRCGWFFTDVGAITVEIERLRAIEKAARELMPFMPGPAAPHIPLANLREALGAEEALI